MRISDWSSDVCSSDLGLRLGLRLCDAHKRRPQQPFLHHISGLQFLHDGAGLFVMLDLHHRLMAVRVELLADGFDPGDAMALEYAFEFLRRHLDTGDDGFHRSEEHTSELQSLMRISY